MVKKIVIPNLALQVPLLLVEGDFDFGLAVQLGPRFECHLCPLEGKQFAGVRIEVSVGSAQGDMHLGSIWKGLAVGDFHAQIPVLD